jgi:hypothetical protein
MANSRPDRDSLSPPGAGLAAAFSSLCCSNAAGSSSAPGATVAATSHHPLPSKGRTARVSKEAKDQAARTSWSVHGGDLFSSAEPSPSARAKRDLGVRFSTNPPELVLLSPELRAPSIYKPPPAPAPAPEGSNASATWLCRSRRDKAGHGFELDADGVVVSGCEASGSPSKRQRRVAPARRGSLLLGDRIIAVNGRPVARGAEAVLTALPLTSAFVQFDVARPSQTEATGGDGKASAAPTTPRTAPKGGGNGAGTGSTSGGGTSRSKGLASLFCRRSGKSLVAAPAPAHAPADGAGAGGGGGAVGGRARLLGIVTSHRVADALRFDEGGRRVARAADDSGGVARGSSALGSLRPGDEVVAVDGATLAPGELARSPLLGDHNSHSISATFTYDGGHFFIGRGCWERWRSGGRGAEASPRTRRAASFCSCAAVSRAVQQAAAPRSTSRGYPGRGMSSRPSLSARDAAGAS